MKVYRGPEEAIHPGPGGSVITIGVLDGVHTGHQAVIRVCRESAEEMGAASIIVTFDRHPLETLAPERAPMQIATLEDRLQWIAELGADAALVLRFDRAMAEMAAERFLEEILCQTLGMRRIVAGTRFHFGKDRRGDLEMLCREGSRLGFDVLSIELVVEGGLLVSSTRIRALLAEGNIQMANHLLTRPFRLHGTVVRGRQLGRKIGFATANLLIPPRQALPGRGVYITETEARGKKYRSVTNVGYRPTVSEERNLVVETHIPGFQDELYGESLTVHFLKRLREERKFENLEGLTAQLKRDVDAALGEE